MSVRVAINGFGRIGRNFLRAYFEQSLPFEVAAINDVGSLESLAHLFKYDSTHGVSPLEVKAQQRGEQEGILVGDTFIPCFHNENPEACPWQEYEVDWVLESTGLFRAKAEASKHLQAGAKHVLIAAVAFDEVDRTVVMGVNDSSLHEADKVVSAASCTTHCIAPVLKLLDEKFGVEQVSLTEMHAYTSDQKILDHVHRDLRRARAGAQNMIPTTTSSISAVQKVLPGLSGKIVGYSMRVPVNNVAAVDLTLRLSKACEVEQVNRIFSDFSEPNIVAYSDLPLVSSDYNHRSESAIFDGTQTQVLENTLKILVWYDNEWGYVNRLIDLLKSLK